MIGQAVRELEGHLASEWSTRVDPTVTRPSLTKVERVDLLPAQEVCHRPCIELLYACISVSRSESKCFRSGRLSSDPLLTCDDAERKVEQA